jgi:hypothetical protein
MLFSVDRFCLLKIVFLIVFVIYLSFLIVRKIKLAGRSVSEETPRLFGIKGS